MIVPELRSHPVAYSVLSTATLLFIFAFFVAWPNLLFERAVVLLYAVFYFVWGVLTHRSKSTITSSVVQEYGFVSLLGALLLLMLTF